jgi:hypothetical protein
MSVPQVPKKLKSMLTRQVVMSHENENRVEVKLMSGKTRESICTMGGISPHARTNDILLITFSQRTA